MYNKKFFEAASAGNLEKVKESLSFHDIDITDHDGDTALIHASAHGQLEIVRFLIGRGANVNLVNKNGFTALIDSVANNRVAIVKILLESGIDSTIMTRRLNLDALTMAKRYERGLEPEKQTMVKLIKTAIISWKRATNQRLSEEETSFSMSLSYDEELAERHLAGRAWNIADGRQHSYDESTMVFSSSSKFSDYVKFYLQDGFFKAASTGNLAKMKELLLTGVVDDINIADHNGRTALIHASAYGQLEIVRFLISKGANVNLVDKNSCTALIDSIATNRVEIVKILLENGIDPTIMSPLGFDALMIAKCSEKGLEPAKQTKVKLIKTAIISWKRATNQMLSDEETSFSMSSYYDGELAENIKKLKVDSEAIVDNSGVVGTDSLSSEHKDQDDVAEGTGSTPTVSSIVLDSSASETAQTVVSLSLIGRYYNPILNVQELVNSAIKREVLNELLSVSNEDEGIANAIISAAIESSADEVVEIIWGSNDERYKIENSVLQSLDINSQDFEKIKEQNRFEREMVRNEAEQESMLVENSDLIFEQHSLVYLGVALALLLGGLSIES